MSKSVKRWYQSRTLWLHIASAISTIGAGIVLMLPDLGMTTKEVAIWTFGVNMITNAAGYYLRMQTDTTIGATTSSEEPG